MMSDTSAARPMAQAFARLRQSMASGQSISTYRGMLHVASELIWARLWLRRCVRGPFVRAVGRPFIRRASGGEIVLGERVRIVSQITRTELAVAPGARLIIGARTFINYGCSLGATRLIQIGERCLLGTYVNIIDNNFHDLTDRRRLPEPNPVTIEDDVWIGSHVIVLPGVRIGRGAVVGAGSVVCDAIPPWTVAAGNPARVIRQLAPAEIVEPPVSCAEPMAPVWKASSARSDGRVRR
jgi:maltose O-acetyltransferase